MFKVTEIDKLEELLQTALGTKDEKENSLLVKKAKNEQKTVPAKASKVLGGEVSKKEQHDFHEKYLSKPTYCAYCKQFIWGMIEKQGYKCNGCKCCIHKKCLQKAMTDFECKPILKSPHLKNTS